MFHLFKIQNRSYGYFIRIWLVDCSIKSSWFQNFKNIQLDFFRLFTFLRIDISRLYHVVFIYIITFSNSSFLEILAKISCQRAVLRYPSSHLTCGSFKRGVRNIFLVLTTRHKNKSSHNHWDLGNLLFLNVMSSYVSN